MLGAFMSNGAGTEAGIELQISENICNFRESTENSVEIYFIKTTVAKIHLAVGTVSCTGNVRGQDHQTEERTAQEHWVEDVWTGHWGDRMRLETAQNGPAYLAIKQWVEKSRRKYLRLDNIRSEHVGRKHHRAANLKFGCWLFLRHYKKSRKC